ncbi:MAG: S8 family serine peptidase, partial [Candidatus Poribacteria bacterium]|nr:S8 family serine peptidase [Candidatus Poribacteria bacterium]
ESWNGRVVAWMIGWAMGLTALASVAVAEIGRVQHSPQTTPRELIVQLADNRDPNTHPSFAKPHQRWRFQEAAPVVAPIPNAPPLRRRIERTWVFRFGDAIRPEQAAADYLAVPGVRWAEPNRLMRTLQNEVAPNDPAFAEQWNLPVLEMTRAWAIERGSSSVIVAVVDTGAAMNHPDLADQLWTNPGEIPKNGIDDDRNGYIDDAHGWDFVDAPTASGTGDFRDQDADPSDESGHGTHVAGIVSAKPDNGVGIAGVAWNCKLMVVRTGFASRGSGTLLQEDDSAAGVIYAAENGAAVINMSWGDERGSQLLRDTMRYAASLGVALVAATGNESDESVLYPAGFPEVISVTASEKDNQAAYFANANAEAEIAAPGISILSLSLDGGTRLLSGTSMATPHVVGVIALMRSRRPSLTVAEIRRILISTTTPLTEMGRAVGAGIVNAPRALTASQTLVAKFSGDAIRWGSDTRLEVRATVGGLDFAGYRLFVGETEVPTEWALLGEGVGIAQAGFDRPLFTWETGGIAEGRFTLRVEAYDSRGNTIRDHRLVELDHTPPQLVRADFFQGLVGGALAPAIWGETDDLASGSVTFRNLDDNRVLGPLQFGTPQHHFILAGRSVLPDGDWNYRFVATNPAGLTTEINGTFSNRQTAPNLYRHDFLRGRTLPALDLAIRPTDFDRDGNVEIMGSTPGDGGFLVSQIYEWEPSGIFRAAHLFRDFLVPNDAGDLDGDGLMEVVGVRGGSLVLLEAAAPGAFPTELRWGVEDRFSARYVDLDGDGRDELVARSGASKLYVYRATGDNKFEQVVATQNPTSGRNWLANHYAVDDFDNDGIPELIFGDVDGDVFALGWRNGTLELLWEQRLRYPVIDSLATGEFNGLKGVVVTGEERYSATQTNARFLVLSAWLWDGRGLTAAGSRRFLTGDLTSAVMTGKMDGNDDMIGIVAAGGAYLLRMLPSGELEVDWAAPSVTSFLPAFYDVTGDGRAELFYNAQGALSVVTPDQALQADKRPFALEVEAVDSTRVRLRWQAESAQGPFQIVRFDEDRKIEIDLGSVSGTTEYMDDTVELDKTYRYEIGFGEFRSARIGVYVGEQPRFASVEPLTRSRYVVAFTLPMADEARQAYHYALSREGSDETFQPSSLAMTGDLARIIMATTQPLESGDYTLRVIDPSEVHSRDGMPLDPSGATMAFRVSASEDSVTSLNGMRVYPNPVRPNRDHAPRVTFDRLPNGSVVRLYTPDGNLVVENNAPVSANRWEWDLLNGAHQPVASGVFIFVVEWNDERRIGRIAVIR